MNKLNLLSYGCVYDVWELLAGACETAFWRSYGFRSWLGLDSQIPSPIAAQGDAVNEDSIAVFCGSDVLYSPYLHHILSFQQSDLKFKVIDMIAVACNV